MKIRRSIFKILSSIVRDFPNDSVAKNLPANARDTGDTGSIPESGRSPEGENGNPLLYSCLENPMDRGAWWATVHEVAKSWTQLSNFTSLHFILVSICLTYCSARMLGAYICIIVISSSWIDALIIM